MMVSLTPRSPIDLRPSPHVRDQSSHFDGLVSQSQLSAMDVSGSRRFSTPPSTRSGPPHQQDFGSYALEAGHEPVEQRPSPQSRQRSWHHPYMQSSRGTQGPSPSTSLETGVGPSSRTYDYAPHDLAPRRRSPPYRVEHLHQAPDPRPYAALRAEGIGRAQPLNISTLPAHPVHDMERVGNIGPNRTRGRSSTLTLPSHDTSRQRGNSSMGGRVNSPSQGSTHLGYDESIPAPPRSWEEGQSFRDVPPHRLTESFRGPRQSPKLRPSSRHSPILFAPLSPRHDSQSQLAHRPSGQIAAKMGHPAAVTRAGQVYHRSRPGTPISPLNLETLSMEETAMPSASGMAAPLAHGSQRSPADLRLRKDYFGPGASEWSRPPHVDVPGSPPIGPYRHGPPHDPRGLAYRPAGIMHVEGISPDAEVPRYHQAPVAANQTQPYPVRGPPAGVAAHHSGMSRAEMMERERYAMAQHHATSPGSYLGHGVPQEHGYQSDFNPQSRLGSGGGFGSNAPPHAMPVDRIAHSRRRRRPPYSYSSMITQAIASSPEGRMTLREIYTWISTNFSGYPMSGPDSQGWQNTVRHNLSLGKIFIKKARTAQDIYDSCSSGNPSQSQAARGKGGWWTLHPVVLQQIRSGQRTHNDEFDDVERLVELENAANADAPATTSTTSSASMDGRGTAKGLAAEAGESKTLSRQRSYSDSIDPNSVEQRRPGSSQHVVTAPSSREASVRGIRNSRYPAHPTERHVSGNMDARPGMPSVLQGHDEFGAANRPQAYGRMRGHTIAVHEMPSHHRAATSAQSAPSEPVADAHMHMRPPSASPASPRAPYQPRSQMAEDIEMGPSSALHKDSSQVLQEARETLATVKQHQKQLLQGQMTADVAAESKEGSTRMAIHGLLNS